MYPVSNAFLQKIRENTREYYWTGTIITKNGTRYTFQNSDILKGSAYINNKSCSADEIELHDRAASAALISFSLRT